MSAIFTAFILGNLTFFFGLCALVAWLNHRDGQAPFSKVVGEALMDAGRIIAKQPEESTPEY